MRADEGAREAGVRVVAAPGVAPGFELAGLQVTEASTPDAARAAVLSLASEPDVGVLLVQEDLVDHVLALEAEISGVGNAALVPFPGPVWTERPDAARAYVTRILRRAVGYRVRL